MQNPLIAELFKRWQDGELIATSKGNWVRFDAYNPLGWPLRKQLGIMSAFEFAELLHGEANATDVQA